MKVHGEIILGVVLLGGFLSHGVGSKELQCPSQSRVAEDCCPCQEPANSLRCLGQCLPFYYVSVYNDTDECEPATSPTAHSPTTIITNATTTTDAEGNTTSGNSTTDKGQTSTLTSDPTSDPKTSSSSSGSTATGDVSNSTNATANDTEPPSTATSTTVTTTPPVPVRCLPCHESCETCNGTGTTDCLKCKSGYEFKTTNETKTCEKTEDESSNVAVIAGASVGGAVVLVGVVVMIVCLCRRCRGRRRRDLEEQGPGMMNQVGPSSSGGQDEGKERKEKEELEMRPSKPKGTEEATYINTQATTQRPISIERGHDKVTRYVRDPTLKVTQRSDSEENELKELPLAPAPPAAKPKDLPPRDEYEITDPPPKTGKPAVAPRPKQPEPPQDTYEDVGTPASHGRTPAGKPQQPVRSNTTAVKTGPPDDKRLKTQTLPMPAASASCPQLAMFPAEIEEAEREKEEKKQKPKSKMRRPPPVPEEKKDEQEASDPEEDYENVAKKKLVARGAQGGQAQGIVNPGAQFDEEPQEVYGNQEIADEHEGRTRYSNTPSGGEPSPQTQTVNEGGDEDDDLPVYGNDDPDDEHPYQNVPLGHKS